MPDPDASVVDYVIEDHHTVITYGPITGGGTVPEHRHDASEIDNLPAGGIVGISEAPGNMLEQRPDGLFAIPRLSSANW